MCGIATIAIGKRARKQIPYHKVRALAAELMVQIEPRGRDASGIAVINDGVNAESLVFKKPLRGSRLVVRPRFKEVLEAIGPDTNFVMLHARASTVGGNAENFNNHPIIVPNFVGIHNGTLYNHEKLFKKYDEYFEQSGNVDSEVIFRLYGHFISAGLDPEAAIKKTAEELDGAFTGAVIDLRAPNRMVMFKYDRTLCVVCIPHYDIIIAVSEAKFFSDAMQNLKMKAKTDNYRFVHDGTGMIFDVNTEDRITSEIRNFRLPVSHSKKTTYTSSYSFMTSGSR